MEKYSKKDDPAGEVYGDVSDEENTDVEDEYEEIISLISSVKSVDNSPRELLNIEPEMRNIIHEERDETLDVEERDEEIIEQYSSKRTSRRDVRWRKCEIESCDTEWKSAGDSDGGVMRDFTSLEYFELFFDDDIVRYICEQTNLYSVQKKHRNVNTNLLELKTFLGINLLAGIIKYPVYRMYWAQYTRYPGIADVMPRNRFEEIKSALHLNDNANMKPRSDPQHDRLFKVRPFITSIKERFLKLQPEEHNSIDEVLIPSRARHPIIQYIKNKPHKWGIKMFARCGSSGMMYDFEIYAGKTTSGSSYTELGISGDVVIRLCENIPLHKNFKVYADNWFSSYKLACALKKKGILFTGCVRPNRLPGCSFESDRSLKSTGRGAFDYRTEREENIYAIKWYDNRPVHLISSHIGSQPLESVQRWCRKEKKYISVARPAIIGEYNKHMGGVDLNDMLVALYRSSIGTKKMYFRIFYALIDVCVVNAWLLYRKDVEMIHKEKPKPLITFKAEIAHGLIWKGKEVPQKRRSQTPADTEGSSKRSSKTFISIDVRYDGVGHFPSYSEKRIRCKNCNNRSSFSRIQCVKCAVGLCITKNKNCFVEYHKKK